MQTCYVTITTTTDGQENRISREGELLFSSERIVLCYREENAFVTLTLCGETAIVERTGDYGMRLTLRNGETTEGVLRMADTEGNIFTKTHFVAYSVTKGTLLVKLQYDLLFGNEKQKMRLRVLARLKRS